MGISNARLRLFTVSATLLLLSLAISLGCAQNSETQERPPHTVTPTPAFTPAPTPTHEPLSLENEATTISAGAFHTCALRSNGVPVCWGWNEYGQSSNATPPKVQSVAAITSGGAHNCMVYSDDSLFCNGPYFHAIYAPRPGSSGHLRRWPGDPQPLEIAPPLSSQRFFTVSSGLAHACGIPIRDGRDQFSVICWGRNLNGEALSPPILESLLAVSSGEDFTCVLRTDGRPVCWGKAYWTYSRIIDGEIDRSSTPVRCPPRNAGYVVSPSCEEALKLTGPGSPEYPPDDERFLVISSGRFHVCALRPDRTPVCWGADDRGQASPPEDERLEAISSGGAHTCALRADGTPVCWGADDMGQASPPEGERFAVITAGGGHTCALRFDASPVCWGKDNYGQASPPEDERFALSLGRS